MTYRLTQKQKRDYLPSLHKHYGKVCFYCDNPFLEVPHILDGMQSPLLMEFDHLDDIESNNEIENIVQAHKVCNQRKKNNPALKEKAINQLMINQATGIAGYESGCVNTDDEILREKNPEIYSSNRIFRETQDYLDRELKKQYRIPFISTKNNIAMICRKKYGFGSAQSVGNAIGLLTSDEADYHKFRDDGKQWLSKTNPMFGK